MLKTQEPWLVVAYIWMAIGMAYYSYEKLAWWETGLAFTLGFASVQLVGDLREKRKEKDEVP